VPYGSETVVFFELDQPFCSLSYGASPCTARLGVTGSRKCYNTRATCQDPANYSPGTLTLRFARSQEGLDAYGPVIPSLEDAPDTTPSALNLAAMERSASALGQREVVTVRLEDHRHSDLLVDKYRLERSFRAAPRTASFALGANTRKRHARRLAPGAFRRPLAQEIARAEFFGAYDATLDPYTRGTFWGKWLARNPFHSSYPCRVREGRIGQALEDMRVRNYIVDRIEGPNDGRVRLVAKDAFSKIEARKAVAPRASKGELSADITSGATSATLAPTGIGNADYPASGHVAIGDEVMAFTRSGDVLTLTRAQFNTTAADHKAEDLVQLVLSYVTQKPHDIAYDLLVNYSEIPAADIPKAEWDSLASSITELFTARITEPTPVNDLLGELCEQAGFTLWPEVTTGQIKFAALRASSAVATISDDAYIVDGSLTLKREDAKRVSQVWVYYGQRLPNEDVEERRNYASRLVVVDTDAEGEQQYGVPAIREVFSRWIPAGGRAIAEKVGERIVAMFRDAPLEVRFSVDEGRAAELGLANYVGLDVAEIQDDTGAKENRTLALVELEHGENVIAVRAQEVAFADDSGDGVRRIFIENDSFNLNLRSMHDLLFAEPTGSEVIEFIVVAGVTIGSTSASLPAMETGAWPTMTTRPLLKFEDPGASAKGRVQGKGGVGGNGGNPSGTTAGSTGGDALKVDALFSVDNEFGEIWGGGGGGAGADGSSAAAGEKTFGYGGPSGGGGAGTNGGAPGTPGAGWTAGGHWIPVAGASGSTGTRSAGGSGATTNTTTSGAGGAPGQSGSGSSTGQAGGAAGKYVNGNANVNWVNVGDVRGNVA
jgi:hypothetical protein